MSFFGAITQPQLHCDENIEKRELGISSVYRIWCCAGLTPSDSSGCSQAGNFVGWHLLVLVEGWTYDEHAFCVGFMDCPTAVTERFLCKSLWVSTSLCTLRPCVP